MSKAVLVYAEGAAGTPALGCRNTNPCLLPKSSATSSAAERGLDYVQAPQLLCGLFDTGQCLEVDVLAVTLARDEGEGACEIQRRQRRREAGHRHVGLPAQDGEDVGRRQRRPRDGRVQPCCKAKDW